MDFSERVAVENGVSPPVADSDARVVLVEVAALRGSARARAGGGGLTSKSGWRFVRRDMAPGESRCASGGMDVQL